MLKRLLVLLGLGCIITCILLACGTTNAATPAAGNEVHMDSAHFVQTSLTVKKEESITLIDDGFVPHIIANGMWENGTAKPAREPGAPEIKNMQINGYSEASIGPFTTAGVFKFYCTVHPGMTLTVVVH